MYVTMDIDESRTQRADDDRDSTCSCCNSPPLVEKWTSDDDNDRRSRSSSDSRASRDSTADWYQQQVVKKHATVAGDFHHSRTPREHTTQAAPAAVSNCDRNPTDIGLLCLQDLNSFLCVFLKCFVVAGIYSYV